MEQQYSTIEEALEELRAGRIIITIDDPDRELSLIHISEPTIQS